jgi:hypothetical protein
VASRKQPSAQAFGPELAGGHRLGGAVDPDRHDRQIVLGGEHGGAATDAPESVPVFARALRVEQQAPSVVEQLVQMAAGLGQAANAALAIERHGVEEQGDE